MTIHGFLTVKEDFGRLYDHLDCYDEVFAVELPGHNGEVDFAKFTVESTKKAVLSAYDALRAKHDQVDVVGFSMGGTLATWLCAERDVHKAVLLAPANKFINLFMPLETAKFFSKVKRQAYRNAKGSAKEKRQAVKMAMKPHRENKKIARKIAKERTFKYMNFHTFGVFRKLVKMSNKAVEGNSPIQTRSLILWGKLDELVPHKSVQYVLDHFVNSEFKIYDDLGHAMLYTNHDDLLITDTMKFLTEGAFCKTVSHRDLPVIHDESEEPK